MNDKYIYSPWRLDYILLEKEKGCIFCHKPDAADDEKHLIVYRSQYCYVILNLFPYNNGHLIVVPLKHVCCFAKLPNTIRADMMETIALAESVLMHVYKCEGVNVGANIGKAAGAGVEEHVHMHLVPRWSGDCNFMSVIGGKRVIPEEFQLAYTKLKAGFQKLSAQKKPKS